MCLELQSNYISKWSSFCCRHRNVCLLIPVHVQCVCVYTCAICALKQFHSDVYCVHIMCRCVCGSLGYYDVAKEKKITLKSPLVLQSCDKVFHKVTTTDDPIIRKVEADSH